MLNEFRLKSLSLASARLLRSDKVLQGKIAPNSQVFHMVDVSTVSTIVATVSVVVGVVFTLLEVRHLARTRRTDVIMKIYESFRSRER